MLCVITCTLSTNDNGKERHLLLSKQQKLVIFYPKKSSTSLDPTNVKNPMLFRPPVYLAYVFYMLIFHILTRYVSTKKESFPLVSAKGLIFLQPKALVPFFHVMIYYAKTQAI